MRRRLRGAILLLEGEREVVARVRIERRPADRLPPGVLRGGEVSLPVGDGAVRRGRAERERGDDDEDDEDAAERISNARENVKKGREKLDEKKYGDAYIHFENAKRDATEADLIIKSNKKIKDRDD